MELLNGVGSSDTMLLLARCYLGAFMVLARFRWFYDPSRPEEPWFNTARRVSLHKTVSACGFTHPALAALVALVEVLAGLALIVGLLTVPAAFGLLVICVVATWCRGAEKVAKQNPVDAIDWYSCYLWTPEPGYILAALTIIVFGPGAISLDSYANYQLHQIMIWTVFIFVTLGWLAWTKWRTWLPALTRIGERS